MTHPSRAHLAPSMLKITATPREFVCPDCGSTFVRSATASTTKRWRCDGCKAKKGYSYTPKQGTLYSYQCVGCGGSFEALNKGGRPRSRCDACKVEHHRELKRLDNQREWKKAASKRRRARERGVEVENFSSSEVFERDNWICWLCGKPTLRETFSGFVAEQPTLDHVIPLAKGGAHALANVRTAHHLCNSLKSDSLVA